jgi:hypothetical protein
MVQVEYCLIEPVQLLEVLGSLLLATVETARKKPVPEQ